FPRRRVPVIVMQMADNHRLDARNHIFNRHRQLDDRILLFTCQCSVRMLRAEIGIGQYHMPAVSQAHRRIADQLKLHTCLTPTRASGQHCDTTTRIPAAADRTVHSTASSAPPEDRELSQDKALYQVLAWMPQMVLGSSSAVART